MKALLVVVKIDVGDIATAASSITCATKPTQLVDNCNPDDE